MQKQLPEVYLALQRTKTAKTTTKKSAFRNLNHVLSGIVDTALQFENCLGKIQKELTTGFVRIANPFCAVEKSIESHWRNPFKRNTTALEFFSHLPPQAVQYRGVGKKIAARFGEIGDADGCRAALQRSPGSFQQRTALRSKVWRLLSR